ncbi:MAG: MarR family winged helix-turn-helix transcriptional regulator [Eubacterium sp.]
MFSEFEILMTSHEFTKVYMEKCKDLMDKYELRKVELDILYFIANSKEKNTAKDIMNVKHISKAHISKSIDNLHTKGFISLEADSHDHRYIHLSVTKKGEPVLKQLSDIRMQFIKVLFNGLTTEEEECLDRVMKKISKNISNELQGGCI